MLKPMPKDTGKELNLRKIEKIQILIQKTRTLYVRAMYKNHKSLTTSTVFLS